MTTSTQPPAGRQRAHRDNLSNRWERFWHRVTEGLELNQLWGQFRSEAKASYRLYSRDVDFDRAKGVTKGRRYFDVAKQFFWAFIEKLSPARRVLLLLALILILWPGGPSNQSNSQAAGFHFLGGLLMFLLLALEVGDRVVMKRDLQIAREIQAWLLPSNPPEVPGLEIAFATRPANTVAGDFYDMFPRGAGEGSNRRYLLAVADVAGKSIPAALLMATFQASLKTLSDVPCSLLELVGSMNRYACKNSQGGLRFTTAVLGEYDPANKTLAYINAGHNAPMLRRKSGTFERLNKGGVPLGILADAPYEAETVSLESGDWLVIFTDGVVEAINDADVEYGEERLMAQINAGVEYPAKMLLSHIMVNLDTFVGNTPQHDDITCMLLKVS